MLDKLRSEILYRGNKIIILEKIITENLDKCKYCEHEKMCTYPDDKANCIFRLKEDTIK